MHCPECDALVPAHREFCPQCGTPTSRVLREGRSSSGRSPEELKRNRRNVFLIGGGGLLLLAIMGKISFINIDMDGGDRDRHREPAVVEAQQLFAAYRDDSEAAEERYGDREIVVTGEFVRIVPDGGGNPDLRLKTSDPDRPLGADLIRVSHEEAAELRPGQAVTVSCRRVAGNERERWLQDCSIEATAEAHEAPAPAPSPTSSPTPDSVCFRVPVRVPVREGGYKRDLIGIRAGRTLQSSS